MAFCSRSQYDNYSNLNHKEAVESWLDRTCNCLDFDPHESSLPSGLIDEAESGVGCQHRGDDQDQHQNCPSSSKPGMVGWLVS